MTNAAIERAYWEELEGFDKQDAILTALMEKGDFTSKDYRQAAMRLKMHLKESGKLLKKLHNRLCPHIPWPEGLV